jgi:hypothetical protein
LDENSFAGGGYGRIRQNADPGHPGRKYFPIFPFFGYKTIPGFYPFMSSVLFTLNNAIMKSKILLSAFLALFFVACKKSGLNSNNNNISGTANVVPASAVPLAVRTAFDNSFSGATEVEWQRNSSSSFTSQFNLSGQRHEASFDDNGHQSSHSVICLSAAVPPAVLDAFRQRFPTDNVFEWKLTNTGDWKAHFMRGTVKWEATFSAAGVFITLEQV